MYISSLVVVKLYAVTSRRLYELRLPPPFMHLDRDKRIQALIKDIIQSTEAAIIDDECCLDQLHQAKAFHIYVKAVEQATQLKLKTLDLLHIAYVLRLAEKNLAPHICHTRQRNSGEKTPT